MKFSSLVLLYFDILSFLQTRALRGILNDITAANNEITEAVGKRPIFLLTRFDAFCKGLFKLLRNDFIWFIKCKNAQHLIELL